MRLIQLVLLATVVIASGCVGGTPSNEKPAQDVQKAVVPENVVKNYVNILYNNPRNEDFRSAHNLLSNSVKENNPYSEWQSKMNREYTAHVATSERKFEFSSIENISKNDDKAEVSFEVRRVANVPQTNREMELGRNTLEVSLIRIENSWKIDEKLNPYVFQGEGKTTEDSGEDDEVVYRSPGQ